jgi:hypothetical protein
MITVLTGMKVDNNIPVLVIAVYSSVIMLLDLQTKILQQKNRRRITVP